MKAWAVLVAAGRGERAGLGMNKAFYPLSGRTPVSRCLDAMEASGLYMGATLVLSASDLDLYASVKAREGENKLVRRVVTGGATRQESAYNGIKSAPEDAEVVTVHDAARPYASPELFKLTLDAARESGSGVISTPVTDTIKFVADGRVSTPPRENFRAAQTPQSFKLDMLLRAYEAAARDGFTGTDDASVFEREFGTCRLVFCDAALNNLKLTNRRDFNMDDIRVGTGFDAHRLATGRALVLCGVNIPYEMGLLGHSDADVALHALMDAMLGAVGAGDIGRHFPDSDEKYRGISSIKLLEETRAICESLGYALTGCDVTIVAQRPKLAPYMNEMRGNIARAAGVNISRVNVKATTTEGMGYEGAGLGISAQAAAVMKG